MSTSRPMVPLTTEQRERALALLLDNPGLTDRQIAKLARIPAYTKVSALRAELANQPPAEPAPAPALVLITCSACGREGSPGRKDPSRCPACNAGETVAAARAAWAPPPRSPATERALGLLAVAHEPLLAAYARRTYVRERARDFGILEVAG